MQSFRTEIENPVIEKDILELEQKIHDFHHGVIDEERFRTLRLARGVYGQRQTGVQMIRIKIPYGKLTGQQLNRIADVSDEYSNGRLHITTRQDIQIHHVSLDRTPELWAELERDDITLREACGNTVRNITASATSGIDPSEVFDVRPVADAVFRYFLRNPICQEMGRKIKISFSNSDQDTALSFMHDIGFIAKQSVTGELGFKVMVAGGLGSQSRQADVFTEFCTLDQVIPLAEAILRVFEHYGERSNRMKARLKFLIKSIGIDTFKEYVTASLQNLEQSSIPIALPSTDIRLPKIDGSIAIPKQDQKNYEHWKNHHVFRQKQSHLFAIGITVPLGDFTTIQARDIAQFALEFSGNELTLGIDQNIIIRHVPEQQLPRLFKLLQRINLFSVGFNTTSDVTSCPGTSTCNLGITSSKGLAVEVEEFLRINYPEIALSKEINVKISGCMNACGQHMIAQIGFQGMTIRTPDKQILPAIQILLGGGKLNNGKGRFADKVIKIPSKRALHALHLILNDHQSSGVESFTTYYDTKGERYFYNLLKPLTDLSTITSSDFIDWGNELRYEKSIGIGECAGVVIDLVSTLFFESEEKLILAQEAIEHNQFSDSIFHSYSSFLNAAKGLLTAEGKKTNSQHMIIQQFQETFIDSNILSLPVSFNELVLQKNSTFPSKEFALLYQKEATQFLEHVRLIRAQQLQDENRK